MTLTTFQTLLSELLAKYNEEAENHYVAKIDLTPTIAPQNFSGQFTKPLYYTIEIKTVGR